MQVSEVLRVKGSTLFTVDPETMLSDCVITMADHDIGSLVVMDHGRLAGMLTFREVLRVLARRQLEHRARPDPAGRRDRRARGHDQRSDRGRRPTWTSTSCAA